MLLLSELPHISYLTRMDIFLMGSTILVFGGLVQAALTSRIVIAGKPELAVKLDLWSRIGFPAGLISIVESETAPISGYRHRDSDFLIFTGVEINDAG
jgi:hypothetical protein